MSCLAGLQCVATASNVICPQKDVSNLNHRGQCRRRDSWKTNSEVIPRRARSPDSSPAALKSVKRAMYTFAEKKGETRSESAGRHIMRGPVQSHVQI